MIIETPKLTRNIIFVKKNGLSLCELNKEETKKNKINVLPNISLESKEKSEFSRSIEINKGSQGKNLMDKKKNLFLNNVLSTEKNYFLKDYIRQKEIRIIKEKNKSKYQARKTFFSEKKIDNCRTSYFNKEINNYNTANNNRVALMIKDIEADLLIMKKKRNEKFKEFLKKELKWDLYKNKYFVDFNEKLGVKNVYMKTDIFNNKKGYRKNDQNILNIKYLKALTSTYDNMKRKTLNINIK